MHLDADRGCLLHIEHQRRARLHEVADIDGAPGDDPVKGRDDGQVVPLLAQDLDGVVLRGLIGRGRAERRLLRRVVQAVGVALLRRDPALPHENGAAGVCHLRQLLVGVALFYRGFGLRFRRLGLSDLVVEFGRAQHREHVARPHVIADIGLALFDIAVGAGVDVGGGIGEGRARQGDVDRRRRRLDRADMDDRNHVAIIVLGRDRRLPRRKGPPCAERQAGGQQQPDGDAEFFPLARPPPGDGAILFRRRGRAPVAFEIGLAPRPDRRILVHSGFASASSASSNTPCAVLPSLRRRRTAKR